MAQAFYVCWSFKDEKDPNMAILFTYAFTQNLGKFQLVPLKPNVHKAVPVLCASTLEGAKLYAKLFSIPLEGPNCIMQYEYET